eukprot:TRINITY_DN21046_c0_g1_i1.p1 TRINITY_DN21046_c0_g1~~TRINITY_DN21046_c0_g1_i1.p1  ORF type:complete len:180 (+),score=10.75 TRINITY_DN21046_c0_g1_i1:30-542(+)
MTPTKLVAAIEMPAYIPPTDWDSVLPALEVLFGDKSADVYLALSDLPAVDVLKCWNGNAQDAEKALLQLILYQQGIRQDPSMVSEERREQCLRGTRQWEIGRGERRSSPSQHHHDVKQRPGDSTTPTKCLTWGRALFRCLCRKRRDECAMSRSQRHCSNIMCAFELLAVT